MTDLLHGEYEAPSAPWVREQVETYEASGGAEGNTLGDTGIPVIIVAYVGNKSGKLRKFALMRVEHEGHYALVASKGGAPENPGWYANLVADPVVQIQDGPAPALFRVRELDGAEYGEWWDRAVAVYPSYAEYQTKTDRKIPVFVAEPLVLLS